MSQLALARPLILKEKKRKSIFKRKEKKRKRKGNNDLANLPSHDTTPLLSFLVLRNFPTIHSMGRPCHLSRLHLLLSILRLPIFLPRLLLLGSSSSPLFLRVFCPSIISNFSPTYPNIPGRIVCPTIHITSSPWTSLVILLVWMSFSRILVMPHLPCLADILSWIFQLSLLHFPNSLFLPKYLTLP